MTFIFNPPHVSHIGTGWKTGPNKGGFGCYWCGEKGCRVHCRNCGKAVENADYCPPCLDSHLEAKYQEVM